MQEGSQSLGSDSRGVKVETLSFSSSTRYADNEEGSKAPRKTREGERLTPMLSGGLRAKGSLMHCAALCSAHSFSASMASSNPQSSSKSFPNGCSGRARRNDRYLKMFE